MIMLLYDSLLHIRSQRSECAFSHGRVSPAWDAARAIFESYDCYLQFVTGRDRLLRPLAALDVEASLNFGVAVIPGLTSAMLRPDPDVCRPCICSCVFRLTRSRARA